MFCNTTRLPHRVSQVPFALLSLQVLLIVVMRFQSAQFAASSVPPPPFLLQSVHQSVPPPCPALPCLSVSPSIPCYTSVIAISWSPPLLDCLPRLWWHNALSRVPALPANAIVTALWPLKLQSPLPTHNYPPPPPIEVKQLIRNWQIDSALNEAANLTALCIWKQWAGRQAGRQHI